MGDFKITVRMSTDYILQNIDSLPNLSDKSKQLIINFCNKDKDKIVTNEIEYAMLDSYVKNEDKVSMPKPDGMKNITGTKEAEKYMGVNGKQCIFQAGNNRILGFDNSDGRPVAYSSLAYGDAIDILVDKDNDGYADYRTTHNLGYNPAVSYCDDNLDGTYDIKLTEEELSVPGFDSVHILTETDIKTKTVKSKTKLSHKIVEDKNGKGQTFIHTETNMLTGEVKTNKEHVDFETGESTVVEE